MWAFHPEKYLSLYNGINQPSDSFMQCWNLELLTLIRSIDLKVSLIFSRYLPFICLHPTSLVSVTNFTAESFLLILCFSVSVIRCLLCPTCEISTDFLAIFRIFTTFYYFSVYVFFSLVYSILMQVSVSLLTLLPPTSSWDWGNVTIILIAMLPLAAKLCCTLYTFIVAK